MGRSQARGYGDPSGEYAENSRHRLDHALASAGRLTGAWAAQGGSSRPGSYAIGSGVPDRLLTVVPSVRARQRPARSGDEAERLLPLRRRAFCMFADPAEALLPIRAEAPSRAAGSCFRGRWDWPEPRRRGSADRERRLRPARFVTGELDSSRAEQARSPIRNAYYSARFLPAAARRISGSVPGPRTGPSGSLVLDG